MPNVAFRFDGPSSLGTGVFETVPIGNGTDQQIVSVSGTFNGNTIDGLSDFGNASNILLRLQSSRLDFYSIMKSDNGVSFTSGGASYNLRTVDNNIQITSSSPTFRNESVSFSANSSSTLPFPCFLTGTLISTGRGDIAVEDLRVGDLAVTASGAMRPIIWIGHHEINGQGASIPFERQPVRIRADAFGHGVPRRSLGLSPGHPVLVGADADGAGGHLVPIMCLINGTTIAREPVASVTYWHVELDAHDILLAEGLAAESYLDWGDRPFFDEASDHALHNPDFVVPGLAARCRPVAVDGPVVEGERMRLSSVFSATLNEACAWDEIERCRFTGRTSL
ncbi:Hint domain-containing protein [Methylobacterium terricola]|uniref:Hint domain-containing protein n=1 Tax=Methylobacterium terricola TaxID=2583531 RepID=A0A5C4LAR1_9HYPH|nr:Hint domain-containing protein [Methylobacterium terricola]TNC08417.1 Hint domain-containing protein [Methylobacterium terricola]